jgi:alpha-tubulin suppressor-like RCC1 family protein
MPGSNYNFTQDGIVYSFDEVFVRKFYILQNEYFDKLWVWGDNLNSKLGLNDTFNRSTPVLFTSQSPGWKQISAGFNHTSAVKTDGTLWVWGNNDLCQLGTGDVTGRSTPVSIFSDGNTWSEVSSGYDHTAAIKTDGTLWAWGNNSHGQLGTNAFDNKSTPVTTFVGGTDWKQVSCGRRHTSAIKTDGTLWSWGNNFLLGYDKEFSPIVGRSSGTRRYPESRRLIDKIFFMYYGYDGVGNLEPMLVDDFIPTFSFNGSHIAAVKTDGTLWVWGNNTSGVLGINSAVVGKSTPVTTFRGGTDWKQVSCGYDHTAAIKTDGTLWTWGGGGAGQLGERLTASSRSIPVTTFIGGTNWKQVSCGEQYTAAIKTDGTLWTWGSNQYDQLGIFQPTVAIRSTPVTTFAGGTDWKQVSCGINHLAAVKTDGTLWMWGALTGNLVVFQQFPLNIGGTDWKQVSCGDGSFAAIKTDGTLWSWDRSRSAFTIFTPVTTFVGGTDWKQVSCGYSSLTAAIKTDGTLWTWRSNPWISSGLDFLGNALGSFDRLSRFASPTNLVPTNTYPGGQKWVDTPTTNPEDLYTISLGLNFSSAIKTDGTLWTWGSNKTLNGLSIGNLGNNSNGHSVTPITTFIGGTNWKQVSCGQEYDHIAAIKTDGTLWTWGNNSVDGQLGIGIGAVIGSTRSTPVTTFAGGNDWRQVSCGGQYTAAIKTDGTLWTWGNGNSGKLGNSGFSRRSTPVTTFAGGTNWKQVSCGYFHTAAIKTDGTLWIWGRNTLGQLGDSTSGSFTSKATPVTTFAGGNDWRQVSCGGVHTAAIKTDGTLWSWGVSGALGSNTSARSTPITTFAGGTDWKQVSAGSNSTVAIKTDGTLWVWGLNDSGQLGINVESDTAFTPITTFIGGTDWKQVFTQNKRTIALKEDGELYFFGKYHPENIIPGEVDIEGNWDQVHVSTYEPIITALKDDYLYCFGSQENTNNFRSPHQLLVNIGYFSTPVTTFSGGIDWKQVSSGKEHTAAVKTNGTLWTWGLGSSSKLGSRSNVDSFTPITTFTGGFNWSQVSCGFDHTAAVKTDGTLWTWGNGSSGRLGDNDILNKSTPTTTFIGGNNWKQVSCGYDHTAAVKTDSTLWIWGNNTLGQLGISDMNTRSIPVIIREYNNWSKVSCGSSNTFAIEYGQEPESYLP